MRRIFHPQDRTTLMLAGLARKLPLQQIPLLSRLAGDAIYHLGGSRRREALRLYRRLVAKLNLAQSPEKLTRQFFRNKLMESVGSYRMQDARPGEWSFVETEGYEKLLEVLDRGKGLVLAPVHFGTMMMTSTRLLGAGRRVLMIRPESMRGLKSEALKRMMYNGCEIVFLPMEGPAMAAPLRSAVKSLRSGAAVGIAIDGEVGEKVLPIPIFGGAYPARPGAEKLARLSGAAIAFGYGAIRNGRYYIKYGPLMEAGPDGYTDEDFASFWQATGKVIEEAISQYPASIWWTKPMRHALGLSDD